MQNQGRWTELLAPGSQVSNLSIIVHSSRGMKGCAFIPETKSIVFQRFCHNRESLQSLQKYNYSDTAIVRFRPSVQDCSSVNLYSHNANNFCDTSSQQQKDTYFSNTCRNVEFQAMESLSVHFPNAETALDALCKCLDEAGSYSHRGRATLVRWICDWATCPNLCVPSSSFRKGTPFWTDVQARDGVHSSTQT